MSKIYYTASGTAYVATDGRITRRGNTPVVDARTGEPHEPATTMYRTAFRFVTPPVVGEPLRLLLHDGEGTRITTSPVLMIGAMPTL